jgi:hypothetical protein
MKPKKKLKKKPKKQPKKKPKAKPKQLYLDKIIAQEEKNKSPTSILKDFYKIGGTD